MEHAAMDKSRTATRATTTTVLVGGTDVSPLLRGIGKLVVAVHADQQVCEIRPQRTLRESVSACGLVADLYEDGAADVMWDAT
jgi:hypothetical protein